MLEGLDVSVGGWADGEMPAVAARCVPGAVAVGVAKAGEVACALPATGWCGCAPMVVARATTAAATDTATSPTMTSDHARRRRWPWCDGWPVSLGRGCPAAVCGVRADVVVIVGGLRGASGGPGGLGAAGSVTGLADGSSTAVGAAGAGSDGACNGNAWVIGAGSHPAAGWAVFSSARS